MGKYWFLFKMLGKSILVQNKKEQFRPKIDLFLFLMKNQQRIQFPQITSDFLQYPIFRL